MTLATALGLLNISVDGGVDIPAAPGLPASVHIFDADSIDAVELALACDRPLLVRGEPGLGKSQLGRAVAAHLGRAFLSRVVDSHTEARDLLYTVDAVRRLAETQLLAAAGTLPLEELREKVAARLYLEPGPLWWALNWTEAAKAIEHAPLLAPYTPSGWSPEKGCVVLVDEIDKADAALPNGLLEPLGNQTFTALDARIGRDPDQASPLIVFTTNEDRALPDAFIRRCVVLPLKFPAAGAAHTKLQDLARSHKIAVDPDIVSKVVDRLLDARQRAIADERNPPGFAEFLDLLRGLARAPRPVAESLIDRLAPYVLEKHRDPREVKGS